VALVRVYCGVATAEMAPWLTVAVVDDSGRLLDMRHVSDDPAGYAYLGALLADRSGGSAPVALDRSEHLIAQLLAAANRPIAICDEANLIDFAERFTDDTSYEETQAPVSQRCAIGLARALQAGALYATAQSPSWNLDEFKPVLAAHAAVTAGRQAAAAALREVLRELYPAALRAYPDPAEYVPLKILEELPEPGLLSSSAPSSRNRDAALIAELSSSGVADTTTAVNAITALRVAVEESPRWNANRALAPVVAETVRQSVAAVRACDAASAALVGTLVERLGALTGGGAPARPYLVHPAPAVPSVSPVSPAVPRRMPGPAAEVPPSRLAPRASAASAAASGVPAAAFIPGPRSEPVFARGDGQPDPGYRQPDYPQADPGYHQPDYAQSDPGYQQPGPGYGRPDPGFPQPGYAPQPGYSPQPGHAPQPAYAAQAPYPSQGYADNGFAQTARSEWPTPEAAEDFAAVYANLPAAAHTTGENQQVSPGYNDAATLSFSLDPLNAPLARPDGAPLRLVDPPQQREERPDPSSGRAAPPQPVLRVIDGGRHEAPPEPDNDLLIFSETQSNSAWFTFDEEALAREDPPSWGRLADEGWRAAEQLTHPSVGADTRAGLPRRVPKANLVPGSAQPPPRQLRIVRDPQSIAAHTSGYFRGWKRGQEIGGFAVGQRDRAAWEFNREQRAREATDQRARLS
jgi:hypothetical protein